MTVPFLKMMSNNSVGCVCQDNKPNQQKKQKKTRRHTQRQKKHFGVKPISVKNGKTNFIKIN
jgi:hypothetical protein